jgi:hypothetical protein
MNPDPPLDDPENPDIPTDPEARREYWLSRTPEQRLAHVQYLRRLKYGPAADGPIERVIEILSLDDLRED